MSYDDSNFLYLDELNGGEEIDREDFDFSMVFYEVSTDDMSVVVLSDLVESIVVGSDDGGTLDPGVIEVSMSGLQVLSDPALETARRGDRKKRVSSENNDRWATKVAHNLIKVLGYNMSIGLGDLSLKQIDELLSYLFSRAVKMDGTPNPASTLMNMCNSFNFIIKQASDTRSLRGEINQIVDRNFNINSYAPFAKTKMVVAAAIKKCEGVNKKWKKVTHFRS